MERFEPLARSIEEILSKPELSEHINATTRLNAERTKQLEMKSKIYGKIPMFAVLSAADSLGLDLLTGYSDLQQRVSLEWKAKKYAAAIMRQHKVGPGELVHEKEEVVQATTDLQAVHRGVQAQVCFINHRSCQPKQGQYVMQNRDERGLIVAQVDDESLYPIVYIDFSGASEGRQPQGSFGSIQHAWTSPDKYHSDEIFAVKVPRFSRTGQNELEKEGQIWRSLQTPDSHPKILEYLGSCSIGANFKGLLSRWVAEGKSWKESLYAFEEAQNLLFLERIADAVSFMHNKLVIHGDLKLANVIISRDPIKPLLCDFGFSLRRELDDTRDSVKRSGSGPYLSPEAYRGAKKTFASDTWSFGIAIMHTLMRRLPFQELLKDVADIQGGYYQLFVLENRRPPIPAGLTTAGTMAWSVALACISNAEVARPEMEEVRNAMQDVISTRREALNARLTHWEEETQHRL
ncbi:p21 protein (Cdc42 Rac)-activated kinase [Tulasnella sp. 427]|nr:p21 protein (Cdc42 Rac)-activated kinase [Tulasnella sp. 427]